jgi:hypothetical protein
VQRRTDEVWNYWAVAGIGLPEDDFARDWAVAEETLAELRRQAEVQGDIAFTDT